MHAQQNYICKQVAIYWTWHGDVPALCFPHCEMLHLMDDGFNCQTVFSALGYSDSVIILDGNAEVMPIELHFTAMTFV